VSGKSCKRDGHPHQCTAQAVAPSAPRVNPDGRCRNVVGAWLWSIGERHCWRHGGLSDRLLTKKALAEGVIEARE